VYILVKGSSVSSGINIYKCTRYLEKLINLNSLLHWGLGQFGHSLTETHESK